MANKDQIRKLKMRKFYCLFFSVIFFVKLGFCQNEYTISGTVTDEFTGESLIGAHIYIPRFNKGVSTNEYGYYSITLSAFDSLKVIYSYLGYESKIISIHLFEDRSINLELESATNSLEEIVVKQGLSSDNLDETQMGSISIHIEKIKEIPAILGEVDVLKALQLLPGVQPGNEGTTSFHVRGGNADQNLVQLDEAIVYNPNHLFGLFSTFNPKAVNNVSLIKGGFPAQYGGRLSSILNINMKEGNNKVFGVEGGLGLVSSQLTFEGPIRKNKSSFIVSGRRTYFDWLIKPFLAKSVSTNYSFYDLNAKANFEIGPKDRIFLSGFKGQDNASYSRDGIQYNILFGNQTTTFRWNHLIGHKLFMNTSIISNKFKQNIAALQDNAFSNVVSGIEDKSAKVRFQYFPDVNNQIRFGIDYQNHTFRSSGDARVHSSTEVDQNINIDSIPLKKFDEIAIYIGNDFKPNDRISANFGLRLPFFYSTEANYFRLEPRMSFLLKVSESSSLKTSYAIMNQFVHLIPSSTAAIPTDIWVPSSKNTRPQFSQQYSVGYYWNFANNMFEASVETYYKSMKNQVLFKEGNQLIASLDVDNLLVHGRGWSYGSEFFLKKNIGRFTGWGSYTLSWTFQKFADLNFGKKFPFRHDRRHNVSLLGVYRFNEKWQISTSFVISSGGSYTVPNGRIPVQHGGSLFEGNYYLYEGRNNTKLNPYHRLNFSVSYKKARNIEQRKFISEMVFSIYNAYNRQNPYFIFFDIDPASEKSRARQVSLLPVIPSFTYNFKF